MRKADELSITIAPAARAAGANSRLRPAPALKKAMSMPEGLLGQLLDLVCLAAEFQRLADRSLGGEQPQTGYGKVSALQDAQDFNSHRAGRADDSHILRSHGPCFR
jgi:hypothetical protein